MHGKNSISFNTDGFEARVGSHVTVTSSGGTPLLVNRKTSDGEIVKYYKDGTSVGAISTKSDDLVIHSSTTNHVGLSFGYGNIIPTNNYGTTSNNTVDLGSTSRRFKDFYLDGSIVNPSGNLTLDVAGYVDIDADNGSVYFSDGGTTFGRIYNDSSNLRIKSEVSDKDIVFQGNDGGSTITALTLDMSAGGTAYFADDVRLTDNHAIRLGTDGNIVFYHDNSNGYLENNTGNLTVDVSGDIILDADGAQVIFKDAGTTIGGFNNSSSDLNIFSHVQDKDIVFTGDDGGSTITALTLDMSDAGKATFNNGISSPSGHVSLGSSSWADDILYLTRSNDGKMQRFFKGTTEVCSIGTSGNQSYIHGASGQTGLYWGTNNIFPYRSTGLNHNTIDLGQPNYRFKDGYFSGNLYGDGSNLTGVGGSTSLGAVGTYAFFYNDTGGNITAGNTISGNASGLKYGNSNGGGGSDVSLGGTWRSMGTGNYFTAGLFVRIS